VTIHSLLHASAVTHKNPFGIWGYDVINFQMDEDLHPRFVSTPVSEGFNLLWKLARGNVLRSKADNPLLFTVAARDGHTLRLLVINRAARPASPTDVEPNSWGWGDAAKALASASEKGDSFDATISLPPDVKAIGSVRVFTLGAGEKLYDRSVDPGTLNVHEIKIKSSTLSPGVISHEIHCTLAPHSATLLEIGTD
jgi:hypothetical protein